MEFVAWLIALPPSAALLVFSIEVLAGLPRLQQAKHTSRSSYVILIPAHNEEAAIAETIATLSKRIGAQGRLLVVADNCTDATSDHARLAGASVVSRNDPAKRGKGFALACGRDFLASDPPEVVVVIDADCVMDSSSIHALVAAASSLGQPVQATNLLTARCDAPPLVQISNFAMLVKNLVRARGLMRLGGGIPLFGTGMAFPWKIFARAQLATDDPVEDLRFAVELADEGVAVQLVERALVQSPSAAAEDLLDQRRRWEHGFLGIAMTQALPLIGQAIKRRSRHRLVLGLHLCVPPLALLLSVAAACLIALLIAAISTGLWEPAAVLSVTLGLALAAAFAAWLKEGRSTLSVGALIRAPLYVLGKLPMYGKFVTSRQTSWNRARRRIDPD
jgi:cellulose synthase/poly-beta-1,6-N-acetylglucosamine synthase-like glycosyltransferase